MEDDLVTSLTRQVKEDVIQNYLLERRLLEVQIQHLEDQAEETRALAWVAGKRLTRLAFLMFGPEMRLRLAGIIGLSDNDYWITCLAGKVPKLRLIRVRAITFRGRFRKLALESYSRLYHWMKKYGNAHEELVHECSAVNSNIKAFQKNFDLLAILNFLRNLDLRTVEMKKILGENFTAKEMSELDRNLYIRPVLMEKLEVPPPLPLPEPRSIERKLSDISDEILHKYEKKVRAVLR